MHINATDPYAGNLNQPGSSVSTTTGEKTDSSEVEGKVGGVAEDTVDIKGLDEGGKSGGLVSAEDRETERQTEKLKSREREVIAHEQAHKAVGGRYAGAASYSYTRGPDGKMYISGGEVSIDTSKTGDPDADARKMAQVRAAALAPANPSAQDLAVAASATSAEAAARAEASEASSEEGTEGEGTQATEPYTPGLQVAEEADQETPKLLGSGKGSDETGIEGPSNNNAISAYLDSKERGDVETPSIDTTAEIEQNENEEGDAFTLKSLSVFA